MQPNEPFFPPLVIEGVTYEFSHLDPFTMRFVSNSANRQLRVNVRFSNHCFSYSPIDGQERQAPLMLFDHNNRERIFCPTRYRLSLSLPDIVRSLNNSKCKVYQTAARRNFNYSLQVDDPKGPYHLGVVRRNPRNFRQPSSSPATSASRSMNLPSVWKV